MLSHWKPLFAFFLLCSLLCASLVSLAQNVPAQAASSLAPAAFTVDPAPVFINEIHYDNTSTDAGEFIEIAGPAGTDLTGWSIVLYNGDPGTGSTYDSDPLSGVIQDLGGGFGVVTLNYLPNGIQNGPRDGIALVDSSNTVVQLLSYEGTFPAVNGIANGLTSTDIGVFEGGSDPLGQSLRLAGTGSSYANFTWNAPSAASPGAFNTGQTLISGDAKPFVASATPAPDSSSILLNANIVVNFSENVTVSGVWFTITCADSGAHTAVVSGGPQAFTFDPAVDFAGGESCSVTIVAGQVTDQDGTADNIATDYSWSFTASDFGACSDNNESPIHTIQGTGTASSLVNSIAIVEGVVVGDYQGSSALGGFYLQEEDGDADADAATSEGIFVFSNNSVNAGDVVRVEGTVTEFGAPGMTLTELTTITQLQVCASGASVTPTILDMPVSNLSDWEQVEGMLVNIPEELTVTENFTLARFGELPLSANGRLFTPTHLVAPGPAAVAQQAANDLNRIVLDDAKGIQNPDPVIYPSPYLSATNTLRTGYTVENLSGIIDQRFNLYRIQPLGPITFNPTNPRTATPAAVGGTLKVAGANVLNYFTTLDDGGEDCGPEGNQQECRGANTAFEFERQRTKIIAGLAAINADIVGLLEIENNESASLQNLVDGLNAIPGVGPYTFIDTGFLGSDAIKVALIYKPATVAPIGTYAILDSTVDPTFIDTLNRSVLAQTFAGNASSERFTVAVNHLKSKGSDCNAVGDPDTGDGQGNCNGTRTAAAAAEVNWLGTDPTSSGDPDFLIIGDMNSYAMENPITTIKNAGYTDLLAHYHGQAAYSYVFEGQSGYLDHALASASLLSQVTGAADWHVNTDEPVALDYNVEFKSPAQVEYFYTPQPYRFSDHDPLVVGLDLASETTITATITIVKDARPDNRRNFRFSGDLGNFRLDDPGFDDHDQIGASTTFDVKAGTYTVAEEVPDFWHLTNIACTGGSTNVNLSNRSVAITVQAGQNVTCTFTNEYGSAIWVDKYNDQNANGRRFWEVGLPGWKMSLYNSAGTLVASDTTNIFGKVHFWNVAPGPYTLCETQRSGWFNSQPGTINPTYNQPCYSLSIGPAQLRYVEFGNHRNARAADATPITPDAPSATSLTVEDEDDESYEDDGSFVDPDLNTPAQGEPGPLFLPQIRGNE